MVACISVPDFNGDLLSERRDNRRGGVTGFLFEIDLADGHVVYVFSCTSESPAVVRILHVSRDVLGRNAACSLVSSGIQMSESNASASVSAFLRMDSSCTCSSDVEPCMHWEA